jgi:hypothetical protein
MLWGGVGNFLGAEIAATSLLIQGTSSSMLDGFALLIGAEVEGDKMW